MRIQLRGIARILTSIMLILGLDSAEIKYVFDLVVPLHGIGTGRFDNGIYKGQTMIIETITLHYA